MAAKDRFFTQLAAKICGFDKRLNAGLCPLCGGVVNPEEFKSDIERKEYQITGICALCQNQVFADTGEA